VHRPRLKELGEVAGFFLRLGLTAFGGPAAHVAMMEREVVAKRGWLSREAFLDLLGATTLIPGPGSTQMAMALGWRRAGWAGLALGGCCFILPAAGITLALAWAYVRFGRLPQVHGLLYGIKPVVLAIVAQALWSLGRTAFRRRALMLLGALALAAALVGVHPVLVLFGAGLAAVWAGGRRSGALAAAPAALPLAGAAAAPTLGALLLFFLKIGSILFGSGYVLLAFLKADLVDHWHWLSQGQLLDAVAAGQVTPGPVFTTATFIGYLLGGFPGAALATAGIFLPSFAFVALLGLLVPRLRGDPGMGRFLDGVNAGALALMAAVSLTLLGSAVVDPWTLMLGCAALGALLRWRINPAWLVLAGGAAGMALTALRY
jgi:chromate transporter